jgi:hypothetical protein
MRRRGANSCEAQNRHASAANPKFAQVCGALGCELRVQKRHYKDRVASVLIDSEVRTSAPKMLTNFGIGTLSAANPKFAQVCGALGCELRNRDTGCAKGFHDGLESD